MTIVVEKTAGKIRSRPIDPQLFRILKAAGELSNVDTVKVISGGQMSLSETKKRGGVRIKNTRKWRLPNGKIVRTGSTRHDNGKAADLRLEVGGRAQDFTKPSERKIFEDFAEFSVALGCTGLGAGTGYMGKFTMHVGFGNSAVWNQGAPALPWLLRAVARGKANPIDVDEVLPPLVGQAEKDGRHMVVARSGLHLRGGPSTDFNSVDLLEFGTELDVVDSSGNWAKVDLRFDGTLDGYVHSAFLRSVARSGE
jgi:hypothetical protein